MKFEDWLKFDLRVGEIIGIGGGKIKIDLGDREFEKKINIDVKKGEKIIVGLQGNGCVIPLVGGNVLIAPEKNIDNGVRIG